MLPWLLSFYTGIQASGFGMNAGLGADFRVCLVGWVFCSLVSVSLLSSLLCEVGDDDKGWQSEWLTSWSVVKGDECVC